MRRAGVLIIHILLACPTFAASESREQKRFEGCSQVFKEIMNIPDGIPKDAFASSLGRIPAGT